MALTVVPVHAGGHLRADPAGQDRAEGLALADHAVPASGRPRPGSAGRPWTRRGPTRQYPDQHRPARPGQTRGEAGPARGAEPGSGAGCRPAPASRRSRRRRRRGRRWSHREAAPYRPGQVAEDREDQPQRAGTQITSRPAARAFTVAAATASAVVDIGAERHALGHLGAHEAGPDDQHPGAAARPGRRRGPGRNRPGPPWTSRR